MKTAKTNLQRIGVILLCLLSLQRGYAFFQDANRSSYRPDTHARWLDRGHSAIDQNSAPRSSLSDLHRQQSKWVYYGHRFYNASTGTWLSRDPKEERGGSNLYGFAGNNCITHTDYLGLGWHLGDFGDRFYECPLCRCKTPTWVFLPGGNAPQFGFYPSPLVNGATSFGTQLHWRWTVEGDPRFCRYFQDEAGSHLTLTDPTGNDVEYTGSNDTTNHGQEWTDLMGFDPVPPGTYELHGTWTISLRCESSDATIPPVVQSVGTFPIDVGFLYPNQ